MKKSIIIFCLLFTIYGRGQKLNLTYENTSGTDSYESILLRDNERVDIDINGDLSAYVVASPLLNFRENFRKAKEISVNYKTEQGMAREYKIHINQGVDNELSNQDIIVLTADMNNVSNEFLFETTDNSTSSENMCELPEICQLPSEEGHENEAGPSTLTAIEPDEKLTFIYKELYGLIKKDNEKLDIENNILFGKSLENIKQKLNEDLKKIEQELCSLANNKTNKSIEECQVKFKNKDLNLLVDINDFLDDEIRYYIELDILDKKYEKDLSNIKEIKKVLTKNINNLEMKIDEYGKKIKKLKSQLNSEDNTIDEKIKNHEKMIKEYEKQIVDKNNKIASMETLEDSYEVAKSENNNLKKKIEIMRKNSISKDFFQKYKEILYLVIGVIFMLIMIFGIVKFIFMPTRMNLNQESNNLIKEKNKLVFWNKAHFVTSHIMNYIAILVFMTGVVFLVRYFILGNSFLSVEPTLYVMSTLVVTFGSMGAFTKQCYLNNLVEITRYKDELKLLDYSTN